MIDEKPPSPFATNIQNAIGEFMRNRKKRPPKDYRKIYLMNRFKKKNESETL